MRVVQRCLLVLLAAPLAFAVGPCESADHRAFDFWVGEWKVYGAANGKLVASNSITREYNGCVIHERYATTGKYKGESLNVYDRGRKVWTQTWVDTSGLVLRLEGGLEGESMVLTGKTIAKNGAEIQHRISWTPLEGGAVRQHWQSSNDGVEWRTAFDGRYEPAESQP